MGRIDGEDDRAARTERGERPHGHAGPEVAASEEWSTELATSPVAASNQCMSRIMSETSPTWPTGVQLAPPSVVR